MDHFRLDFPGRLESLGQVAEFVHHACQTVILPESSGDFLRHLDLVVSEAVTNAIRHGTRGGNDHLTMFIDVDDDGVTIRIRDHGAGFDLDRVASPNLEHPAEGGYGIYIIKSLMDEVRYDRKEDGNELVMSKRFPR